MFPEIIIGGSKGNSKYWCKSFVHNEKAVEGKQSIKYIEDCYLCENLECIVKKNIEDLKTEYFKHIWCYLCPRKIDFPYFLILYKLKKTGLLIDKFAYLCCFCFDKYNLVIEKEYL